MDSRSSPSLLDVGSRMLTAETIAVASHTRPDGDAIGSVIALTDALRSLGKRVYPLNQDGVPGKYRFLEGSDWIEVPDAPVEVDLLVALDTGDRCRIGERVWQAVPENVPVVVMDHHVSNERYGDLNLVDPASPATGQLIFELVEAMGWSLSRRSREAIWVAIATDTGSFQYPSTTPATLRIAARLLEEGLDLPRMTDRLFQAFPLRRLELLRELLDSLQRTAEGSVAWWKMPLATLERLEIRPDDAEGLIDHLRAIEGVTVAVSFEEAGDGTVRVSARSKNAEIVDVSRVCSQFGGGGHRLAAGARIHDSLDAAAEAFISAIITEISHGND